MNGYSWQVRFVDQHDPMLVDRTGVLKVATTDPMTMTVYLSENLEGDFLNRVLIHELGHCALFSFDLLSDIHRFARPECWIEAEEWVCNFIADYGMIIFESARDVLGDSAWTVVPGELERLIA
ncbi:MAG: protein of unknown function DUF3920 [Chaetfec virus UA24_144]|nr:MAG: protein of unknown function DUF3920 [Chaetfec virus UA24_144]